MKIRKTICLSVFLVFISFQLACADSPVWKVAKGDHQLFIGGTIHILSKSDYPLPQAFEDAYRRSSKVVFETDIQKVNTPEFQKLLMGSVTYSKGQNLKMFLSATTYQALTSHLASRGVPMDSMVHFKAGMVAITVTVIELQRLGLIGAGVDEFFSKRAINDGKDIGKLETVDEQLAFISAMGEGREDDLIAYTLRDIKNITHKMNSMKAAWRKGDHQRLKEIALAPIVKDFPEVYRQLLVKRNNAWIPKIEAMLKTKDIELVLVGMLHLVGDDGLLALLAAQGYQIQKL